MALLDGRNLLESPLASLGQKKLLQWAPSLPGTTPSASHAFSHSFLTHKIGRLNRPFIQVRKRRPEEVSNFPKLTASMREIYAVFKKVY